MSAFGATGKLKHLTGHDGSFVGTSGIYPDYVLDKPDSIPPVPITSIVSRVPSDSRPTNRMLQWLDLPFWLPWLTEIKITLVISTLIFPMLKLSSMVLYLGGSRFNKKSRNTHLGSSSSTMCTDLRMESFSTLFLLKKRVWLTRSKDSESSKITS